MIMVTAMHDVSTALEAIRRGAYDYILKPFEKDQLFLSVRRALEHRRLLLENRHYQRNLEQLVEQRTGQLSKALSELEQSYDATLEALGGALDLKDSETVGHCKRVTAFTMAMAKAMNLPLETLPPIARAATPPSANTRSWLTSPPAGWQPSTGRATQRPGKRLPSKFSRRASPKSL